VARSFGLRRYRGGAPGPVGAAAIEPFVQTEPPGEQNMATVEVKTEITGNVWKVLTSEGSTVAEGDVLVILESMKMEIPVMSPEDGVVKSVKVEEGGVIAEGETVVVIEA
jgi:biotin carboxyl carrier protein